jgi:hypothetical protein
MLPDLRIVIAAVVSTFICTVGVGFYASSRLLQEPLTTRSDNADESPINRIALSWPEPLPPERSLNLDFAVTAKVSKNPVREISEGTGEAQSNAVATPSNVAGDLDPATQVQAKDFAKEVAREIAKETAKEIAKEAVKEIAKELGKEPAVRLAAGLSLVEPDPHRLEINPPAVKLAAGPSLVEPDPHRLEINPPAIGSAGDADPTTTASLPDRAGTSEDLNAQGEPTTRIRIVKKPVAKARIKRKRVAVTPPAPPILPGFPGSTAQLQFPFMFFLGTSSPN